MRTLIILLLFLPLLSATSVASAQIVATAPAYRQYATQLRLQQLISAVPGMSDSMASIERFTAIFRTLGQFDTVSVALVIHLMPLPAGGIQPGAADLQAQIDRLNTDFFNPEHLYLSESYQHPALLFDTLGTVFGNESEFQPYLHPSDNKEGFAQHAALPLIRFCLANLDPNGQPTNGIVQPGGEPRTWGISDSICRTGLAGSDAWNPVRYCNVWVARLADDYAGYAQMPGGPLETDGIVIDDRYFAKAMADSSNPYYLGRTLVHLMGSYLNLYELWNDSFPCADDYVEDTPIHSSPNSGMPLYKHVSLCSEDNPVEMTTNLMDNTDDAGQYLFTWGQVLRMQATLAEGGPRNALRYMGSVCSPGFYLPPGAEERMEKATNGDVNELDMRAFPNPTAGNFIIEIRSYREMGAEIRLFNASGVLLHRQPVNLLVGSSNYEINAISWEPGFYTIVFTANDAQITRKVLIER